MPRPLRLPRRPAVPDPASGIADCPHRRVLEGQVIPIRAHTHRALRQIGTCYDCGHPVARTSPPVIFGPWTVVAKRVPAAECRAERRRILGGE